MYAKILVPIDGSETSLNGLNEALKIAKNQGSTLRLLHVVNEFIFDYTYSPGFYAADLIESLRKSGQGILDAARATAQRQGVTSECVLLEAIGGVAADFILEQAKVCAADLIVMGTNGRRGLRRLAMGSDAEQVVRGATIPVLLVRGPAAQLPKVKEPASVTASAA